LGVTRLHPEVHDCWLDPPHVRPGNPVKPPHWPDADPAKIKTLNRRLVKAMRGGSNLNSVMRMMIGG